MISKNIAEIVLDRFDGEEDVKVEVEVDAERGKVIAWIEFDERQNLHEFKPVHFKPGSSTAQKGAVARMYVRVFKWLAQRYVQDSCLSLDSKEKEKEKKKEKEKRKA